MWGERVASSQQGNLLVLALAYASAYKRNIRVASLICFAVAKRISSCASSSIYCEAGLQWAIGESACSPLRGKQFLQVASALAVMKWMGSSPLI